MDGNLSQAELEDCIVDSLAPTNEIIDSWILLANGLRRSRKAKLSLPAGVRRGPEGNFYRVRSSAFLPKVTSGRRFSILGRR